MPDKKLTDNEVVKALECCKTNRVADCKKCAFHLKERKPNINCVNELIASSIDLINRLQAENDNLKNDELPRCKDALRRANEIGMELQAENENYSKNNRQMTSDILELYKELERAKAENERLNKEVDRLSQVVLYNDGVTEMKVEEAKAEAYKEFAERMKEINRSVAIIRAGHINNLLKELVGEDNG